MIKKKVLHPKRVRKINGGFSFIPHRFILDGFLAALGQKELLLYLFLVIVSDEYIASRDSLIEKDLIAFDGTLFQVLSLPQSPPDPQKKEHRSPLGKLIQQAVKGI
jgi:hypothetical protein